MHDDSVVVLSESLVSVSLVWLGSVDVMDWTVVVGVDVDTGDSLRSVGVVVVSYSSSSDEYVGTSSTFTISRSYSSALMLRSVVDVRDRVYYIARCGNIMRLSSNRSALFRYININCRIRQQTKSSLFFVGQTGSSATSEVKK